MSLSYRDSFTEELGSEIYGSKIALEIGAPGPKALQDIAEIFKVIFNLMIYQRLRRLTGYKICAISLHSVICP